ncbi:divIVA family protein [Clostridium sp. CAG:273]|nr:divIVA family protein [Clostridium sp. CAG:273]
MQELEKYKNIESTLQNTLIMAQSTADEIKKVAKQEADQLIREAQGKAKEATMEIEKDIAIKTKELDDLQKQFDVYKAKMESLLISQLELLKDSNKE